MKKWISACLLLSVLLTSGCAAVDLSPEGDQVSDENYTKSSLNRETSPNINMDQIQILAKDNTNFALSFYDQIRQEQGNIIFSPISLSLALSMTLAGAESATEEGMLEALSFSLQENEIYPTFNALLLSIEQSQEKTNAEGSQGNKFQLSIANSIWGQSGYDFNENFLDTLAINYGAGLYTVNFQEYPDQARKAINDWVETETQDKIKDLIPPGAIDVLTRLVLANAIYFKGSWQHPFSETGTEKVPFFNLDGSEVESDLMQLFGESLRYMRGQNFQAVDLPYLSRDFSMTVIVPDQGAFEEFEKTLTAEQIIRINSDLSSKRVNLRMPKFDYESSINANDPLAEMGMSEAFDPYVANFSGINDANDLFITDVLHKATITVDEKGTEAAAATAVIMGLKSAPPEDPISLTIDRPFMYFIQHNPTGSILFFGRVTDL
jgi:serpin B